MQTGDGDRGRQPAQLTVPEIIARQRLAIARHKGSDKPMSIRELSRRTINRDPDAKGVAHQHLAKIADGLVSGELPTLGRLARGLAVSDQPAEADGLYMELAAAWGMPDVGSLRYTPPDAYWTLNARERDVVDSVAKALASAKLTGQVGRPPRADPPGP